MGYRGILFDALRVDAVAFFQQIRRVIGDIPLTMVPSYRENLYGYDQVGTEIGLEFFPTRTFSAFLNYTFLYSRDHDRGVLVKEWPMHLYGLGGELRLPWRSRLNAEAYLVFDYRPTISGLIGLDTPYPHFLWRQVQAPDQAFVNLRFGRFFFDDKAELFVMAKNILGFLRDRRACGCGRRPRPSPSGASS